MYLGLDDTDSPDGMCTTYLGALLARKLEQAGYTIGELRLVRLNPNVIWKTRGNAAVCLEVSGGGEEEAFLTACGLVEEYAEFACENTNPGVVAVSEKPDPAFYYKALRDFCSVGEAVAALDAVQARYRGYKCGRGLIGALAAVSSEFNDHTFECLAYRTRERFGTPREFSPESFFASEKATYPHTWDTIDPAAGKVVCIPHGKDPVLYGIRGDSPAHIIEAVRYLKTEQPQFSRLWITNQGTDAHLVPYTGTLKNGISCQVAGTVIDTPETLRGGHVRFMFRPDSGGESFAVFAYEPTKSFRNVVRQLLSGDQLTLCGSCSDGAFNLEKFRIDAVAPSGVRKVPVCPECGGRMTSAGKNKGYKCRSCSARVRVAVEVPRQPAIGWYEVPPGARRHLAKPLARENIIPVPANEI
jgi:tRNA(Ile2)-agmatinylcytidine synthase